MRQTLYLRFDGLAAPVALAGCDGIAAVLAGVLRSWPFEVLPAPPPMAPVMTLSSDPSGYLLTAAWLPEPLRRRDAVAAVCALVAELFQAELREDPARLCLHCAAAEFAGRLVLFPSAYRAGKSVLSVSLAAAGTTLFTDDVLLVTGPEDHGIACGVLPRLRLPLPDDLASETAAYIEAHRGPAGVSYLYVDLPAARLAPRGRTAPIGGIVLLEREAGITAELQPIQRSEALHRALWQNFARQAPAETAMMRLHGIVSRAQCYRLRYGRAAQAAGLLREAFAAWDETPPLAGEGTVPGEAVSLDMPPPPAGHYQRSPVAREVVVDGDHFLAGMDGRTVHHLNLIGSAVWRLLKAPTTAEEILSVLHNAFPEVPRTRLEGDLRTLLAELQAKMLIRAGTAPAGGSDRE